MADTPDLTELIEQAAQDPASAESDGQKAQSRPIADLIAADRYLASKAATSAGRSGWGRVRRSRSVPPGAV